MKTTLTVTHRLAALMLGTSALFAGCDSGTGEKVGEKLDQVGKEIKADVKEGVREVKDTVSPPGPAQKVGEKIDDAVAPK